EDTPEINIPHDNWIQSISRIGYGPSSLSGEKYGEVTMFDLLRAAFRQRPDYVIVGEVRGKEAYVLFQGMASGHASLGTMHSNSIEDVVSRLETPPINLPPGLIKVLDLIVIQSLTPLKGKSARRTKEIIEVHDIDMETDKPNINKVYRWEPKDDEFYFSEISYKINELSEKTGIKNTIFQDELCNRTDILRWMIKKKITGFERVSEIIADYYQNPDKILAEVNKSGMKKTTQASLKGIFEEFSISPDNNENKKDVDDLKNDVKKTTEFDEKSDFEKGF
ncbi:MAG: Flp pilus assembly complex ATPase component TadA, partial [Candidatus Diapherotrites archaeon]|nr:Flp pilus assembly complex ATPase component TadA [Candidatus Diapherotrites archaeon]